MKKNKAYIILLIVLMLIIANQPRFYLRIFTNQQEGINILCYHHIVPDKEKEQYWKNNLDVMSLSNFESHMDYLYRCGYQTISLEELYQWKEKQLPLPKQVFVLTFDDGYTSLLQYVQPILQKYQFTATSFIIGSNTPKVTTIPQPGHLAYIGEDILKQEHPTFDFYSHGYDLHSPHYLNHISSDILTNDFDNQAYYTSTKYFAYPYGHDNAKLNPLFQKMNVQLAFDYNNLRPATLNDDFYCLPRWGIYSYMQVKQIADIFKKNTNSHIESNEISSDY